jgi:hypothetical protein
MSRLNNSTECAGAPAEGGLGGGAEKIGDEHEQRIDSRSVAY